MKLRRAKTALFGFDRKHGTIVRPRGTNQQRYRISCLSKGTRSFAKVRGELRGAVYRINNRDG